MGPTLDRQVVLVKGKHRYLFRYQQGSEIQTLDAFVSLAADTQSDFDWFDAAVLSYQISKDFQQPSDVSEWNTDSSDSEEEYWP